MITAKSIRLLSAMLAWFASDAPVPCITCDSPARPGSSLCGECAAQCEEAPHVEPVCPGCEACR